ncbi:MAG: LacI family transcriptional regulator [Chitinophagaceae bacterium]|nr:MAG: LacI family transcriptional regulator [Chitinophagaceae bacterium]
MQKKTSLKDIASKVGVSTALVSYVLNGRMEGRISKEVAKKIRDAAEKLNYHPNHLARSLKTSRTNTIGLVVADISNPFSSMLARIIEDEADRLGYTVIFGSSDESEVKSAKLITALRNRQVDGLIICPPAGADDQVRQLKKQGIPFVLVDRYFPDISCDSICIDNEQASFRAVEHLIRCGRQRIGMITYDSALQHLQDRITGYGQALAGNNIKPPDQWKQLVGIHNDQAEIHHAMSVLLNLKKPVDAIVFGSNRIASSALKYLDTNRVKNPSDLWLLSFDQSEVFDFFHAPVSYVSQPLMEMGQQATRLLLSRINGTVGSERVLLTADLIIRQS